MAYDKVVDSSVLNAGLKTIADAIREKAGTSDSLAFPTAMAEAIAAIEAGGGGCDFFDAYGTYIPAENHDRVIAYFDTGIPYKNQTFNDGNNCTFILWKNSGYTRVKGSYEFLFRTSNNSGYSYSYGTRPSGDVTYANNSTTMNAKASLSSNKTIQIEVNGTTTGTYVYGLVAGVEYKWAFIYPVSK